MASLSSNEQRRMAYFHSLSKVMTENVNQDVYNSIYKSAHSVRLIDIWSDNINYCVTFNDAYNESLINSAITFYSAVTLTSIPGSNNMSWYFNSGGTFIRPWVSPVDVPNNITNLPSYGFEMKLYTSGGTQIGMTTGAWSVDYYAGIIHFGQGYTPIDLGWGIPKASFFQYSGNYGISGGTSSNAFTTVTVDSGTSIIYFNSGGTNPQIIDLGYLNTTGFTSVQFDSGTNYLWFNKNIDGESYVDLSTLKSSGSGGGLLSPVNINMVSNQTNSGSTLACNTGILYHPITGSTIMVYINGIRVNVGSLVTDDCYFSPDGLIIRSLGTEIIGDKLYWRYNGNIPYSGYDLSVNDRITFTYLFI